jgi:hypothetical protein
MCPPLRGVYAASGNGRQRRVAAVADLPQISSVKEAEKAGLLKKVERLAEARGGMREPEPSRPAP